jgi:RimJ/RimL family protein N-acetyltransferase
MYYPLEQTQLNDVRPLFSRLEAAQPMCTAVLERIYPGKVFVDHPSEPTSALLTTFIEDPSRGTWGFLAGDPTNEAFNHALNAAFFSKEILDPDTPVLLLTCDPGDWDGQMPTLMAPRPPIWMPRWHFISRKMDFDWGSTLPEGFTVQQMGEDLLSQPGLEVPGDVRTTIEKWRSIKNPHFKDYGYITIDERQDKAVIASWATVDFVARSRGDLGFFTQPDYRRRGLGTIAAAAALEHGFGSGLSQINWTCAANNQGSIHTAEKLGLERIEDYQIALLVFNQAEHYESLGYFALQAENYAEALMAFDEALKLAPDSPAYVYYEAAQASSMAGEPHKALDSLAQAAERGWKDAAHAGECQAFASLHDLPEWGALLEKMEGNKRS